MSTKNERRQIQKPDDTPVPTKTGENGLADLEALRQEVVHGFLYAHTRANGNTGKALEIASFSYALIELLQEKGLISIEELDARKKEVGKRLVKKFAEQGLGVVALQENEQDKYTFDKEAEIDCESRVHLCQAACCRMDFALSKQDIEEGIIRWDLGRPYMISKDRDGYCRHIDRSACRCTVYAHRPVPCRGYDCRTDERVWLDFEQRRINPGLEDIFQKGGMSIDDVDVSQPAPER